MYRARLLGFSVTVCAVLACLVLQCAELPTAGAGGPADVPAELQKVFRRANANGTVIDTTGGLRIRAYKAWLDTTGSGYELTYTYADSFGYWKNTTMPSGLYDYYIINNGNCTLMVTYQNIPWYSAEVCDSCISAITAFAPAVIPEHAYVNDSVYPRSINDTLAYVVGSIRADTLIQGDTLAVNDITTATMEMTNTNLGRTPLTIKGAGSQAVHLVAITDSIDAEILNVWHTGHINNVDGLRTVTPEGGPGLWVHLDGEDTPEHTNQAGWYDHTGGTFENLLTKTSGDDFTQADADSGSFILFTSVASLGKAAHITEYISTTQVIVDGMGWGGDIGSGGSPETFYTYKHPSFYSGDGSKHEFSVESSGVVDIHSYDYVGEAVAHIEMDTAVDGPDGLRVVIEGNGHSAVTGIQVDYTTGALGAGEVGAGILVTTDESDAVASDATTLMAGVAVATTAVNSGTNTGFVVLTGHDIAYQVQGATAADPDYGYEVASSSVIDRVNSGGGGDDAFVNNAVNEEIFSVNADYILIGDDATFEVIDVVLTTASSHDLTLTFWYSKTGGGWTSLPIHGDGSAGMTMDGAITFSAPGDWTTDDEAEANGDITNGYYVKIVRTRVGNPSTDAVESFFKIRASQSEGMTIDGLGVVHFPYLGGLPSTGSVNGSMWYEADGVHVWVNGGEQTLAMAGGDAWSDPLDSDIVPTGADDTYSTGTETWQLQQGWFDAKLEADTLTENSIAVLDSISTYTQFLPRAQFPDSLQANAWADTTALIGIGYDVGVFRWAVYNDAFEAGMIATAGWNHAPPQGTGAGDRNMVLGAWVKTDSLILEVSNNYATGDSVSAWKVERANP